jgi:type II secretory pathway pseudopilin PulG
MKKIFKKTKFNAGMSYVELIVVLSIFAIMSSIILFNYQTFIARIEVRKMTSLIALKLVEAQKNAIAGVLPPNANLSSTSWKPSYGLSFKIPNINGKEFRYFADLSLSGGFNASAGNELIETITIGKGVYIQDIIPYDSNGVEQSSLKFDRVDLVFTRPSSSMKVYKNGYLLSNIGRIEIIIASESPNNSDLEYRIEIQSSGRIQIKK